MCSVNSDRLITHDLLAGLIESLPQMCSFHVPCSVCYDLISEVARREVFRFGPGAPRPAPFGPFGEIDFPFFSMGAINSLHLFGLDELILFAFYWQNRNRYERVADIGANIGLHSVVLSRCGYTVRSYEPDPDHFSELMNNLERNSCANVDPTNAAVSSVSGEMDFIRVLGNTTGSHLAGSKLNPYGDLKRFPVKVEAVASIMSWADLVKLDVEGHERDIILAMSKTDWHSTDAIIEVENADNAEALYNYFDNVRVNLFSQKIGWALVTDFSQMPSSYKDGMLFASCKDRMPW